MHGLFCVIDRNNPRGLEHWADELYSREIPALILVDKDMPQTNPKLMRDLAQTGFDIGFSYNDKPVWDMSYDEQWEIFHKLTSQCEACTGTKLKIFGTKLFSYNEATLQIAQVLGIKVMPARGTAGAKAVVYQPQEYDVRILSVSNVPSTTMGTGSLCDWSLYSRGETPTAFGKRLLNLNTDRIVLVSQTHLGGLKVRWWNVYQEYLNACLTTWQSLDDFTAAPQKLPLAEIPVNKEAQYINNAKPVLPLNQEIGFALDRHNPDYNAVDECIARECGIC